MPVKCIFNTSTNAPQLSGQAGALIALLDGFLVNGYVGHTPPGGWVKAFSGTNKAVYRSEYLGASGMYYRVDDSTTTYATITGYEAMTDVDTGTNAFGTLYWRKSNTADAVTRPYCVAADERTVMFAPAWHGLYVYCSINWIGDFISHIPGDGYNAMLTGDTISGASNPYVNNNGYIFIVPSQTQAGQIIARSYAFNPGGVLFGKSTFASSSYYPGSVGISAMPNPANGDYYSGAVLMSEGSCLRGTLPGISSPLHTNTENLFASHQSSVDGINRTFIAVPVYTSSARYWIDITGPWQ